MTGSWIVHDYRPMDMVGTRMRLGYIGTIYGDANITDIRKASTNLMI